MRMNPGRRKKAKMSQAIGKASAQERYEVWLEDQTATPYWLKVEVQSNPLKAIGSIVKVAYLAGYAAGIEESGEDEKGETDD